MSDTKNVKLGVCLAYFDGYDLGYTKGGVEVSVATETHPVNVDQFGKSIIKESIMGRTIKVKVPMAETTLENMLRVMPGSTLVSDGVRATGTITIATQPTTGQTITVNGKTITFKAVAGTPTEVAIGTSTAITAANLAAVLKASIDPALINADYTAAGNIVTVTYETKGTAGNAFTIATGTAGASVTTSGATLAGGVATTKARVDVTTGVGVDMLEIARVLRLHPKGKAADDASEDFVVPLASTAGALTFAYQVDNERIFNVEFTGYPDPSNDRLFYIGDPTAA